MGKTHVLALPYPAQGHVIPLLELSQTLVRNGCKVTFVNTDFNHERFLTGLGDHKDSLGDDIELVSIPDGMEPGGDRTDLAKLCAGIMEVMPGHLEGLIARINGGASENVTCVVADGFMGVGFQVAKKMGIPSAAFWPASAAVVASLVSIPRLIDDGIIDQDGNPVEHKTVQLAPGMPLTSTKYFIWTFFEDSADKKTIFRFCFDAGKSMSLPTWKICNSSSNLEAGAFAYLKDTLPVGPLLASNRLGDQPGGFWKQNSDCLEWLDQQPPSSVVYVAFGSFTVLDETQFVELALGLDLSGKQFLWVVRDDCTFNGTTEFYPKGFQDRVRGRGCLVGWAPQQKVLSHPSVACFVSHCGWNSTIEGVKNGVPFLCWPYFADQLSNESYICDIWKVGLRFERNENGIITRDEIGNKIEQLLRGGFKEEALKLKQLLESDVTEDGPSRKNLKSFIEFVKASERSCSTI